MISLIVLFLCLIILLIGMIILEIIAASDVDQALIYYKVPSVAIGVLLFLSLFAFIIGLTGYQANFRLDQLVFEACTKSLSRSFHSLCYMGFSIRITMIIYNRFFLNAMFT